MHAFIDKSATAHIAEPKRCGKPGVRARSAESPTNINLGITNAAQHRNGSILMPAVRL
jgi:hypothetical protein